jgi:hypothetical protein
MVAIAILARVWWWFPLTFALVVVAPLVVGGIIIGGLLGFTFIVISVLILFPFVAIIAFAF